MQALKSIGMTPRRKTRQVKPNNSDTPSQSDRKSNVKTKTTKTSKRTLQKKKKKEVAAVDPDERSDSEESDSGSDVFNAVESDSSPLPLLVHHEEKDKSKKMAALFRTRVFAMTKKADGNYIFYTCNVVLFGLIIFLITDHSMSTTIGEGRKRTKNMAVPLVSTVQKGEMMTEVEKKESAGQEAAGGNYIFFIHAMSCCLVLLFS